MRGSPHHQQEKKHPWNRLHHPWLNSSHCWFKYLGVTIQSNLSWKPHINNITKRANSTLGFLRRNLRKCPSKIKEQAYRTFVHPTLEYASSVWDSSIKDQVTQIEKVQRRAARFTKADYHPKHSVTKILNDLQWQTLQERRAHSKVIMLYRIVIIWLPFPLAHHTCCFHLATQPGATNSNSDNSITESKPTNTASSQVWSVYGMIFRPQLYRPSP